ncbi:MAG: SufS family cysteine desulfurase [Pseudomonadota bacterium]
MSATPAKQTNAFDAEAVRADFPILASEANGKPLVYLDNAASAQKPRAVMDAMRLTAEAGYANVHRGLHYLSNKATADFEAARGKVASFLNAARPEEIVFTSGGTAAVNLVAYGLAPTIKPGDEIILSIMEHHSNIVPWHFLRERHGAVLKWVDVNDDGSFDIDAYKAAFTDRTRFVAITHMSNVLGTQTPGRELSDIAHAYGVEILLDGCQSAVHGAIDVQALDCDYFVATGHKLYGPTGIGVLYGKYAALEALAPFHGGGEMIETVTEDTVTYNDPPHRFEAGTPPILEAIGLGAAIDYMMSQDGAAVAAHEAALLEHAAEALRGLNWVEAYGAAPCKGAILSFNMDGAHAHDVATLLDQSGVAVRAGHHCAQPLMRRLGVPATARASFAMYNTHEDVDAFVAALQKARAILG